MSGRFMKGRWARNKKIFPVIGGVIRQNKIRAPRGSATEYLGLVHTPFRVATFLDLVSYCTFDVSSHGCIWGVEEQEKNGLQIYP